MERSLMYLRKSRMDTDFEEVSIAETLSRHRTTLEKFCKSKRLNVVEVLEEVVSGESLAARPQMMRLLELVSTGDYRRKEPPVEIGFEEGYCVPFTV